MLMDTKQRILEAALLLFSQKGYSNVYVGEIAELVGIKAPSLYKHYTNKQAIFDAIVEEMQVRYSKEASLFNMHGSDANADSKMFLEISEEKLVKLGTELFKYFLYDEYASKFRRMLTIEQFNNEQLARLYDKLYIDDPLEYQGVLFGILMAQGVLRKEDLEIMTLHFYAPIYTLLTVCDRNPSRESEVIKTLEKHIKQFSTLYGGRL